MFQVLQLGMDRIETPIGTMLVVGDRDGNIRATDWSDCEARMHRLLRRHYGESGFRLESSRNLKDLTDGIGRYFAGELEAINALPVKTAGTPFQREVWRALRQIPCGTTISYAELARRVGRPSAVRAVGLANGSNPVGIVVPCHRVIGSGGSLTGYTGGIERKAWLLEHESQVERRLPRELSSMSGDQSTTQARIVRTRLPEPRRKDLGLSARS